MFSCFLAGEGAVRAEPDDVGVGGEDPRDLRVARAGRARQEDQGMKEHSHRTSAEG